MMRRVVVTGIGLVTPLGCGVDATWTRLVAGENAAARITDFEVSDLAAQIACQVPKGARAEGRFNPDEKALPLAVELGVRVLKAALANPNPEPK